MPDTIPLVDDPTTAELMEGVNEARILLASDAHRRELAELAAISRWFVEQQVAEKQERYKALQASIDGRNAVYAKAEAALHGHLATKHAPQPETPGTDDPEQSCGVLP